MKPKIILDSNIIIYSTLREYEFLRQIIGNYEAQASAISKLEVLGFARITPEDKQTYEQYFQETHLYPVSLPIINHAITLRQVKKMSLGDAIIASTALLHNLPIMTRNDSDFNWIYGLQVINPFPN